MRTPFSPLACIRRRSVSNGKTMHCAVVAPNAPETSFVATYTAQPVFSRLGQEKGRCWGEMSGLERRK